MVRNRPVSIIQFSLFFKNYFVCVCRGGGGGGVESGTRLAMCQVGD